MAVLITSRAPRRIILALLVLALSTLLLYQVATTGAFSNGPPASLVLGTNTFTTYGWGTSQTNLNQPRSMVVDLATGKLFVADGLNHRVLRFAARSALTNGAPAEAVLGQPNFTSGGSGLPQQGFSLPSGLTTDASGWLWVADYGNHRVLLFDSQEPNPKPICACGTM